MSLRARLVVGLLALAAVGLVLLAGVTYAEQRTFLLDRVDVQTRFAMGMAQHRADDGAAGGQPDGGDAGVPGDGDRGAPGAGPGGGPPPGAWTIRRSASGATVFAQPISRFETGTSAPKLPARLSIDRLTTIKPANKSTRFRVLAEPDPLGAGTIAVAVPLGEVDQTLHRLVLVEGLVIAAILLALGSGAWWLVRIGLRPLDRMADTAGAIAAGDLAHRVQTTGERTEVGRLGVALNRMLDRLEQAFAERQASEDRLRRFLADASHELRTPLSSIRGYAELYRLGAAADPEQSGRAMRRIEAEAARMGVLVEDLLALARLDEVREAHREPVNLARLAGDAVDDARAVAPDREITLHTDGSGVVQGDPHQLRQVLGNLLRNALVHTPAGTPVEVQVRRDGEHVELAVRDHGPGLPTEDDDQLFERFWRAEAGRERGKAGAGLGLAIVAGIVAAHGGEVRAENAAGGGARFVVRL